MSLTNFTCNMGDVRFPCLSKITPRKTTSLKCSIEQLFICANSPPHFCRLKSEIWECLANACGYHEQKSMPEVTFQHLISKVILITSTRKNLVSKVLVKTLPGTGEYSGSFQFCFVLFFSLQVLNLLSDGSEICVKVKS